MLLTQKNRLTVAGLPIDIELPAGYGLGVNYTCHLNAQLRCERQAEMTINIKVLSSGALLGKPQIQETQEGQTTYLPRSMNHVFRRKSELLIANRDFSRCRVWCSSPDYLSPGNPELSCCGWPLLAVWGRLAVSGRGMLLHGSLLYLNGCYVLLLGDSGAGKSTLSRLAVDQGAICLTDENPFFRFVAGSPCVYGSPWYSDESLWPEDCCDLQGGLLSTIFILRHHSVNTIERLKGATAGLRLLRHIRTFNWLPRTIPPVIEQLDRIVSMIPIYDLGFVPDESAVKYMDAVVTKKNE